MSIIVMSDDDFEKNMDFLASQFNPVLADSFRHRDTAQREALARVEAERDYCKRVAGHNKTLGERFTAERDTAQAQLAEALGLLRKKQEYLEAPYPYGAYSYGSDGTARTALAEVKDFLALHAQAEQQQAQGAQAGDETQEYILRAMGLNYSDRHSWDKLDTAAVIKAADEIARLRAALTTQPAVSVSAEAMSFEYAHISGERRTVSITREDVIEGMEDALYEKLSDQICRCEPIGETNVVECNCQDYVEEFTLVSAKPAVRGAEHE